MSDSQSGAHGSSADDLPARPSRLARGLDTFVSLRYRNFRYLWGGTLISSSGDWMDQVALNWLVVSQLYSGVDAALPLALLNGARAIPILLVTPIGGVLADRMERRRLMFTTQSVAMVMAFALAVLVSTGLVEFWMVLLISTGRGVMNSFNMPARQSLISELVPRESLMNAVALNSATMNLTRVLGPTIGAAFLASPLGVAGAFYFNGATFIAVLAGLLIMDIPPLPSRRRASLLIELGGGFKYIKDSEVLRPLVILAAVPMVFGMPYQTLSALVARDVLDLGGSGYGLLTAATGIGAVVGAMFIASRPPDARKGRMMLIGLGAFGLAIVVFAGSVWFPVSIVAMVAVGLFQQVYLASNNTLLQLHADDEYRGRVMSMLFLSRGTVPLGTLIAGLATTVVGVQWAMGVMASVLIVMAVGVAKRAPRVRAL